MKHRLLTIISSLGLLTSHVIIAAPVLTTWNFNSSASRDNLVHPVNGEQNSQITHEAAGGVNGSGALIFKSLGDAGNERRYFGLADSNGTAADGIVSFDATTVNQWLAKAKMRFADLPNLAEGAKTKAHLRVGFVGDPTVTNPLKPQDALKNPNQASVQADFKIEWDRVNSATTYPKINVEAKSWNGVVEAKATKFEQTFTTGDPVAQAATLTGWYEVQLLVTRTALTSNDYLMKASIFSLGNDGLSSPTLVGTSENTIVFTNAALSADTTLHPFLVLEMAKEPAADDPATTFAIDDWTYGTDDAPGPDPPPLPQLVPQPGGGALATNLHIPFNSETDLDGFSYTNQNSTTLGYSTVDGISAPNLGAGVFQSTGTVGVDRRVLGVGLISDRTVNGPQTQQWSASAYVRANSVSSTPTGQKYKAQLRLGFLGSTTIIDPAKPQDVWKLNPSFHADFKIEWDRNLTTAVPKLSLEGKTSTGGGQESKTPTKFETTQFNPLSWYRVELIVKRMRQIDDPTKVDLFALETSVYHMEANGLGDGELIGRLSLGNITTLSNQPFSTDTTIHSAFMLEGEKNYSATPYYNFYLDELAFQSIDLPQSNPPAPAPEITIVPAGNGQVQLSWTPTPGYQLQTSLTMAQGSWVTIANATSPYLITPTTPEIFFRMSRQ